MLNNCLVVLIYFILINLSRSNNPTCVKHIDTNNLLMIDKPVINKMIKTDEGNDLLGTLTIDKINIKDKAIYKINSKKNNIDKNITILKDSSLPNNSNSIVFLAAHSGYGSIAYFKNLYKLNINDIIIFHYLGTDYIYRVNNIYEEDKIGYIKVDKESNKELILTTCSENEGKQLIIQSTIEKEID